MRRSSQSGPRNSDRISVSALYFPASTHTYHSGSDDRKPSSLQTVRNSTGIPVFLQAVRNLADIPVLLPAAHNLTDIPVPLPAAHNLAGIPALLQAVRNLADIPVLLQAVRNLAGIPVLLQAVRNFAGIRLRIPAFLWMARSLADILPVRMQDSQYRYQPPAFFLLMLQ